jgi:hypothetical protein
MVNVSASLLLAQFVGLVDVHDMNILEESVSINIVVGVHLSGVTCIDCKISAFSAINWMLSYYDLQVGGPASFVALSAVPCSSLAGSGLRARFLPVVMKWDSVRLSVWANFQANENRTFNEPFCLFAAADQCDLIIVIIYLSNGDSGATMARR